MNDRYRLRALINEETILEDFDGLMHLSDAHAGGVTTPIWMADGSSFCYVAGGAGQPQTLLRVDGETGHVEQLLELTRLCASLKTVLPADVPAAPRIDRVIELGERRFRMHIGGSSYVFSTDDYVVEPRHIAASELQSVDAPAESARNFKRVIYGVELLVPEVPSPDRRWHASVNDNNVMIRSISGEIAALTTDGTREFAWDIESRRMRVTAGLGATHHDLYPWSPDGGRLFAVKLDRRAVAQWPYIAYLEPRDEVHSIRIARAGEPLDVPHPHVIDVRTTQCTRLELGDTENQFFTLIGWSSDGSEVLFSRHSREFRTVEVLAGNPADGSVRALLSETSATFVAVQHDVIFSGNNHVKILDDGEGFIWRSSRTGWNHFYLYAMDGSLTRALTHGDFPVIDLLAVDKSHGWIYFTAHHDPERPYDTHLCRVRKTGGPIQRLTEFDGQNEVHVSPSRKTFLAVNSRTDRPYRTDLYSTSGKHVACVKPSETSRLEGLRSTRSEEFTVTAADEKTTLWGVMHKPADLDERKQYPVIDHIYAGPQIPMVRHAFGSEDHVQARLDRALASLGYIVVTLDARGTPERSKAFHDTVYGNFGRHEIRDHVAAIKELAERHPFMDSGRVGVWGHSWGGYFTIRALALAPDVFRVGVASAPAINPYDLFIYEPYLGLPQHNKEAYDYANNKSWTDHIVGRLMLVIGTADAVRTSMVMGFVRRLIQAGVDHELVTLPDAAHSFGGDKNEDYFVHKLVAHFEIHLKRRGSQ